MTIRYDGQVKFDKFSCDEPALNTYLHQNAVSDHSNNFSTLYFLVNDLCQVGAFFVLSNGSIRRNEDLPNAKAKKNLKYPVLGTVHIGRLARHKDMINMKLGQRVMFAALETAVETSKASAAWAVTVHAKNKKVADYYYRFGFTDLKSDPTKPPYPKPLYMRMVDAKDIVHPS